MRQLETTRVAAAALALAMLVGHPRAALADPAATGEFFVELDADLGPPITASLDNGQITFDDMAFPVGGDSVNLGASPGTMTFVGNATVDAPSLSADFTFAAADTTLDFVGTGIAACDRTLVPCDSGQATFIGVLDPITDTGSHLPGGFTYLFDGTINVNFATTSGTGPFGINAYPTVATPAGSNVLVESGLTSYFDSRENALRDYLAQLIFETVNTPGGTTFFGKSVVPGALPESATINPAISTFIDIDTDASYTGDVEVCVGYPDADQDGIVDGTDIDEMQLLLLHQAVTRGQFEDVTSTIDTEANMVCGSVPSLSPFVVAVGPPLETTTTTSTSTTTITTTSTTTSTLPALAAGKKLLLKDKVGKPQKRKIVMLSKDKPVLDLGEGNGTADDPVLNGGSLRAMSEVQTSPGGAFLFDVTYDLPSIGWKYVGKEGQGKGYKFKGSGPIKTVIIKSGKLLKVVGKGGDIGLGVTNPDPVNVVVTLGGRNYCLAFGGSASFKEEKKYLAKNSNAPTACPGTGSPSGAFLN